MGTVPLSAPTQTTDLGWTALPRTQPVLMCHRVDGDAGGHPPTLNTAEVVAICCPRGRLYACNMGHPGKLANTHWVLHTQSHPWHRQWCLLSSK